MSSSKKPHELTSSETQSLTEEDIVFVCPSCKKKLVLDRSFAGQNLSCPLCNQIIHIPEHHEVVTLSQAPETVTLKAKPQWEQDLIQVESALKEARHQREEASNHYKQHVSEANRLKVRIEKLDARLKELEVKKTEIKTAHPS